MLQDQIGDYFNESRNDGGLDHDGKRWSNSGHILKVQPMGFADIGFGCEGKRSEGWHPGFQPGRGKDGVAITWGWGRMGRSALDTSRLRPLEFPPAMARDCWISESGVRWGSVGGDIIWGAVGMWMLCKVTSRGEWTMGVSREKRRGPASLDSTPTLLLGECSWYPRIWRKMSPRGQSKPI